ncbi:hypothetical protein HMPREF3156_01083 [Neisseria sp. HMSC06F02]|nr:hypothetical protein HMPREF3156_01083 [Neisseria sp. HMSC06F02]
MAYGLIHSFFYLILFKNIKIPFFQYFLRFSFLSYPQAALYSIH